MSAHTIITPTPNLEESIHFYESLGFTVARNDASAKAMTKDLLIRIDSDRYTRAGIQLSGEDWSEQVNKLKERTNVVSITDGYHLSDPSGVRIILSHQLTDNVDKSLEELTPSALGNYAGISLETTDMKASVEFYTLLGFKTTMGSADQGWLTMENQGKLNISIMKSNACPHLFFNPSLTFFNGKDNLKVIEGIRSAGISITEEVTYFNKEGIVDNIIIRDPGGYGFFIFSD